MPGGCFDLVRSSNQTMNLALEEAQQEVEGEIVLLPGYQIDYKMVVESDERTLTRTYRQSDGTTTQHTWNLFTYQKDNPVHVRFSLISDLNQEVATNTVHLTTKSYKKEQDSRNCCTKLGYLAFIVSIGVNIHAGVEFGNIKVDSSNATNSVGNEGAYAISSLWLLLGVSVFVSSILCCTNLGPLFGSSSINENKQFKFIFKESMKQMVAGFYSENLLTVNPDKLDKTVNYIKSRRVKVDESLVKEGSNTAQNIDASNLTSHEVAQLVQKVNS
jgi:hypothetical protein